MRQVGCKSSVGEGVVAGFRSRAARLVALGLSRGFGLYVGWFFLVLLGGMFYRAFFQGIQGLGGVIGFLVVGWAVLVVGHAAFGHIGLPFLTMFIAGRRSYILASHSAIVVVQSKSRVNVERFELAALREAPEVLRVNQDCVRDVVFGYSTVHVPGDSGGSTSSSGLWHTIGARRKRRFSGGFSHGWSGNALFGA